MISVFGGRREEYINFKMTSMFISAAEITFSTSYSNINCSLSIFKSKMFKTESHGLLPQICSIDSISPITATPSFWFIFLLTTYI